MPPRPKFLLPLASSLLALFLLMTPQSASANAIGGGLCGSAAVDPWVCVLGDFETIHDTCDQLCPDWTWFQCRDMGLSCYNDPW